MANYDYNKKFNEILDLSNQYQTSTNDKVRQDLTNKIEKGFKEINQNISRTDKKAIADLKKFGTRFNNQFSAIAKHESQINALQSILFGGSASNISEDEIQREMNAAKNKSTSAHVAKYSIDKNDSRDVNQDADQLAEFFLKRAKSPEGMEEDLELEEALIGLPPDKAAEMRQEYDDMTIRPEGNAPSPEQEAKDWQAITTLPNEDAAAPLRPEGKPPSIEETNNAFQTILNISKDAADSHLTQCAQELFQTALEATNIANKEREEAKITNDPNKMKEAAVAAYNASKAQEVSNAVTQLVEQKKQLPEPVSFFQQGILLENHLAEQKNTGKKLRENLGSSEEVRQNPTLKKVAETLNRFIESTASSIKNIKTFFLNPIKSLKSFFKEPTKESNLPAAIVAIKEQKNDLLARNNTLQNEIDSLKKERKTLLQQIINNPATKNVNMKKIAHVDAKLLMRQNAIERNATLIDKGGKIDILCKGMNQVNQQKIENKTSISSNRY